jgi:glycosyltransferase involved in cell wall biosynthesis
MPAKFRDADQSELQYRVTAIICALNEEQNLVRVIPKIPKFVDEVILVDGHSTDRTVQVAKELMSDIIVLTQPEKGKGDALRCGFNSATGDIIVTLDADGSTDPSEMFHFIEALLAGCDFAKGTRLVKGRPPTMQLHRWIGNIMIVGLANLLFGTRYTDICSGYNAFWRKCIGSMRLTGDGYEDEPLMIIRGTKAGLRIVECASHYDSRIAGESKAPALRQAWKSVKTIVRERLVWNNPVLLNRFQRRFNRLDILINRFTRALPTTKR